VIANGQVMGGYYGIDAFNDSAATDLTVNAASGSGGDTGISVSNNGTGAASVIATGTVIGIDGTGMYASNNGDTTGLTVKAADVSGGDTGISVSNNGTGAASVIATGTVIGTDGTGIYASNEGDTTGLTVKAADVSGGNTGIHAYNYGAGATSVTATGTVIGTDGTGIWAQNADTATDLTVEAAGVTGGDTGIHAYNYGTGATSVIAYGQVMGGSYGIDAFNDSAATDLTVKAGSVSGGDTGILVSNNGTGATSVTATGLVTGKNGTGIYAENGGRATDLTVNAASVSDSHDGIYALNYGTGATSVTATGLVTGKNGTGIYTENGGRATDLTVDAAAVTGRLIGIDAWNKGTGETTVTATGQVTGQSGLGYGIRAENGDRASNLTVTAVGVAGGDLGIFASNFGTGDTIVTATGLVTGTGAAHGYGIWAQNNVTAHDLTVNATSATGRVYGIYATNVGTGATLVNATGEVKLTGTGATGDGIRAQIGANATDLTVNAASVTGRANGIFANNTGTGATSVIATGQVAATNATGNGIRIQNTAKATGDLTVDAASVTGGANGIYADNQGTGATSIATNGLVEGGTSAISATSAGQPITITTNGLVRNLSKLSTSLAIQTAGGTVALTNVGFIMGTVSFAAGVNTMDNDAVWNTAGGVNAFGGGTLTNTADGTIIAAGNGALPVTTVFGGLGSFVNYGVLTMANGVAGDIISQTGGNAQFEAGSVLAIDINAAGQADKFTTTGSATINGGTVNVLAAAGNYSPTTTYTILTTDPLAGGRNGTFDDVTSNLAFLNPTLTYDPNNVYLTMARNDISFQGIGITPNQMAAGRGVESLGFTNPAYTAVLGLSASQARYAFDQLSGEIHASVQTSMIEDSRFLREAAIDRLRHALNGAAAGGSQIMAYASDGPVLAPADTERFAMWARGFGSWGSWNSDGNAAKMDRTIGGLFVGADAQVFDNGRLGVIAGYSRSDFKAKDRYSSGMGDNYMLGLYGGAAWGDLAFRSGAAYTWHDLSFSRSVGFPGFSDSLMSDYNAGTVQVFGELGYSFRADAVAFEPFANLAYVNLHTDGFTERGGAAALTGNSSMTDATLTTLGLRASTSIELGGVNATARGALGWRHAFGDTVPNSRLSFTGGTPFSIAGTLIARDAAEFDAGLDFALSPSATLAVSYGGQFGSGVTDQSVRANFNVNF
jgi:outer membrane autotransporter protein